MATVALSPSKPIVEELVPLQGGRHNLETVSHAFTEVILDPKKTPPQFWYTMGIAFVMCLGFLYAVTYLLWWGVGVWGINVPVSWGFAIINFVWWIGIGHAGTLISAILLLFHQ